MWVWCLGVASMPLHEYIGHYGYDAYLGKCHIINCDRDRSVFPAGGVILSFGVGLPCLVIIASYAVLIFRLVKSQTAESKEVFKT